MTILALVPVCASLALQGWGEPAYKKPSVDVQARWVEGKSWAWEDRVPNLDLGDGPVNSWIYVKRPPIPLDRKVDLWDTGFILIDRKYKTGDRTVRVTLSTMPHLSYFSVRIYDGGLDGFRDFGPYKVGNDRTYTVDGTRANVLVSFSEISTQPDPSQDYHEKGRSMVARSLGRVFRECWIHLTVAPRKRTK
jgi:hypothetical protein